MLLRALQGVNSFPSRFLAGEGARVPFYRDLWFFTAAQTPDATRAFCFAFNGGGIARRI